MTTRMLELDAKERATWTAVWATTIWEVASTDRWQTVPNSGNWVLISAWNPWCPILPAAVNRARDGVLHAELVARHLQPVRSRGRAANGSWSEDGWMIPDGEADVTRLLLERYGQMAGVVYRNGVVSLVWGDGYN